MHSAQVGCGAAAPNEPDDCCPGTTSSESVSFQAQLLSRLQLSAAGVEADSDIRPFPRALSLELVACPGAVSVDLTSLLCVLLL